MRKKKQLEIVFRPGKKSFETTTFFENCEKVVLKANFSNPNISKFQFHLCFKQRLKFQKTIFDLTDLVPTEFGVSNSRLRPFRIKQYFKNIFQSCNHLNFTVIWSNYSGGPRDTSHKSRYLASMVKKFITVLHLRTCLNLWKFFLVFPTKNCKTTWNWPEPAIPFNLNRKAVTTVIMVFILRINKKSQKHFKKFRKLSKTFRIFQKRSKKRH